MSIFTNKKRVADTIDYYRREEVVRSFEADRYSTLHGKIRYELQNEMAFELLKETDDPILEIAGGSGRFSRQFVKQGRELCVIDASWNMIKSNRDQLLKQQGNASFVQGTAEKLPFKPESFSTVFCVDMFSHIENPQPVILEMSRVLKGGGHLVINFTNKSSLMGLGASFVSNPLRRLFGKLDVCSTYHWSRRFLKNIDQAGFKRIRTSGLFFVDPRLYRFNFGTRFMDLACKVERWMSRRDCRFLYEQLWVKAVKES